MPLTIIPAAIYLILLLIALRRRTRRNPAELWLVIYNAYSVLLAGIITLADVGVLPGLLAPLQAGSVLLSVVYALSTALMGFLTLAYLKREIAPSWVILVLVWLVAIIASDMSQAAPLTTGLTPAIPVLSLALRNETFLIGWLISAIALFGLSIRAFLDEHLPLYANRILFWVVILPPLLLGDALSAWPGLAPVQIGLLLRAIGAVAATYAVITPRVIDVRELWRWLISRSILTLVTGLLIFGGMWLALYFRSNLLGPLQRAVFAGAIALLVAALIAPVGRLFRWLMRSLISRDVVDPATVVRLYSQRISGLIDLHELANTAIRAVTESLTARRGYLILATTYDDQIMLETVGVDRAAGGKTGVLHIDSPIYHHFIRTGHPLLQYDLDYQKEYIAVSEAERSFFDSLEMDIYAPVVRDENLIGILAVGPKINDDPFSQREIELLAALANQTVAALENARLVTDLRALNERITALNENLRTTNQRLEQLDLVKSDFIAIASHELRTPLTQIQGYSDLLLEMARRNMLDPLQTEEITRSLGKASQRMADVINSMLDVSQIDVENMDLNFVETNLASIIKLAVDPYRDAILQRRLTLMARGLRDLPPIKADYKRLVQAFQNLITNAIKFTPDGGQITITGQVYERAPDGSPLSVRITVADTGIGIDPENQELIFEKFFRVGSTMLHSTGDTKFKGAGPGLGLAIAKGIVEGHGGVIWVESAGYNEAKMPGSAFHVVLPLEPPAVEAQQRIRQMQVGQDTTMVGQRSKAAGEETEEAGE
ncbi:MAG: hypothetical protein Kow00124_12360 [Anaerolineae bacterium]